MAILMIVKYSVTYTMCFYGISSNYQERRVVYRQPEGKHHYFIIFSTRSLTSHDEDFPYRRTPSPEVRIKAVIAAALPEQSALRDPAPSSMNRT
jgi:hypothetical protein